MSFVRIVAATLFSLAAFASSAYAQTVSVLVMQEDWDEESIQRDNRIQRATLISFQKVLNAPTYGSMMRQYGLEGLDVYDETALAMNFYDTNRVRRGDEELIALAKQVRNVNLDVIILYTLYAKAVKAPNLPIDVLQASMQYRVIDVKSGRFFGGDTVDIDTTGIPFEGCAASLPGQEPDAHCVKEFVAQHSERMAEDAANKIALQIAALIGQNYGGDVIQEPVADGSMDDMAPVAGDPGANMGSSACANVPTTYVLTFKGFDQRQVNAIEEYMAQWACAMNLDMLDSSFSQARYQYKTRADKQRLVRNVRLMSELMGVIVEPTTIGQNEIVVETLTLRTN